MGLSNIASVKKQSTGGKETYSVFLANSDGRVVWSASGMSKSETTDQLLEIGIPVYKVPQKFAEAENLTAPQKEFA